MRPRAYRRAAAKKRLTDQWQKLPILRARRRCRTACRASSPKFAGFSRSRSDCSSDGARELQPAGIRAGRTPRRVDHIGNWAGRVGAWTSDILLLLFGLSSYWLIVLLARRIIANYRRITQTGGARVDEDAPKDRTWLAEAFAFVLVLLASDGIEALRMWSLKVQLPRAPGGVVGEAIARHVSHALGFTGATLFLLIALAIGLSLYFRFSWLSVCEKARRRHHDRDHRRADCAAKRGATASSARRRRRSAKARSCAARVKIEDHEPVDDRAAASRRPRNPSASRRKSRCRSSRTCRAIPRCRRSRLLDAAPEVKETISADTLEYTSRLIEKKLKDFGVEVSVVAAYPGPVVTRYEIEPATGVKGSQIVGLGEGSRALAVARVDSRRRDDSGQEFHGARIAEPAPPDGQALRDSRLRGLRERRLAADDGPRQGHRRQVRSAPISRRCRTCWSRARRARASRSASTR